MNFNDYFKPAKNVKYILDGDKPVAEPDLAKWAVWFQSANRQVGYIEINGSIVSTVFMGLDHGFDDGKQPIVWETMVFGGTFDEHQQRCAGTREQAEAMHESVVKMVRDA